MNKKQPDIISFRRARSNFPHLFSSLKVKGLRLKNRVVVAPMTRTSATEDGRPTREMAGYYATFARGGFALLISEGTYTDEAYSQGYVNQPGLANESQARAWKEVVAAVHAAGAAMFIQLMHAGALGQAYRFRRETIAPSAIRPLGERMPLYGGHGAYPIPRKITHEEIEETIQGFRSAAVRAREVGFDGIEMHGANGYLIDQFLTEYTNQRSDEYGGSLEHRVRYAMEVLQAVRNDVGADYPVGIRISQTKVNNPSHRWAGGESEAAVIFKNLAQAGADFIHVTSPDATQPAFKIGPSLAALAKKYSDVFVIANGGLGDPEKGEALLAAGEADLISLAKGALANMDWPERVAQCRELTPFDFAMLQPRATLENAEQWRRDRRHLAAAPHLKRD